jgi:hypothetical protein
MSNATIIRAPPPPQHTHLKEDLHECGGQVLQGVGGGLAGLPQRGSAGLLPPPLPRLKPRRDELQRTWQGSRAGEHMVAHEQPGSADWVCIPARWQKSVGQMPQHYMPWELEPSMPHIVFPLAPITHPLEQELKHRTPTLASASPKSSQTLRSSNSMRA